MQPDVMEREYLVSYGPLGDFGRFRPERPLECRRGDRVVVRGPRGVEVGEVLCDATPRHADFLPGAPAGAVLRRVTDDDEPALDRLRQRGQDFFEAARRRADELSLPIEILDAEVLFDGDRAVLHYVRWSDCDLRDLVSGLSRRFSVYVLLQDLTRDEPHQDEAHGCGDCGSGGCGSGGCGSGGCGSCGSGAKPDEVQAYFAALREQMIRRDRVPLL